MMEKKQRPVGDAFEENDQRIRIPVNGISDQYEVFHLTDTHITQSGPGDERYRDFSQRMDSAYAENSHYLTDERITPDQSFCEALDLAKNSNTDLIALTGDIINNPSATSVEWVVKALDGTGIEYVYTAGNHDWHYEGMPGSDDDIRAKWRSERLLPFYRPGEARTNPGAYVYELGEINIVAIDNSTYQVNEEQLGVFRNATESENPVVLLIHIPISVEGLASIACGHPEWGAAIDKNYTIERRQRWPETGNIASTVEFVRLVSLANNLIAVFSGHLHVSRIDAVAPKLFPGLRHANAKQYITRAGAHGGNCRFTFFPARIAN